MPTDEKRLAAATVARVERGRMDAMLDEALGETFPASDPVAITLVRRDAEDGETIAPDTVNETPLVGDAARDSRRRRVPRGATTASRPVRGFERCR